MQNLIKTIILIAIAIISITLAAAEISQSTKEILKNRKTKITAGVVTAYAAMPKIISWWQKE